MKRTPFAIGLAVAIACAACAGSAATSPSPTSTGASLLLGTWSSVSPAVSTPGTCANFQWTVNQVSGLTASGAFSATCFGTLQVTGTGTGTLVGTSINWSVAGNSTGSGTASCAVAASGSASLQIDGSIQIPYSGTTCLGPVSGTLVFKRR